MVMKILVEVLWVVTPYSTVTGYQHLGGTLCLHLHPTTHIITQCHNPEDYD